MLDRMRLRHLLLGGVLLVTVALVAGLVVLSEMVASSRRQLAAEMRSFAAQQALATRIGDRGGAQVVQAAAYLAEPDPARIRRFYAEGRAAYASIREYLLFELDTEERVLVERIKEAHAALEVEARRAFDAVRLGRTDVAGRSGEGLFRAAARLESSLDDLVALHLEHLVSLQDHHSRTMRSLYLGLALLGTVLVALLLAYFRLLDTRLFHRLQEIAEATERFGRGDFGARVRVRFGDELSRLGLHFNRMARRLSRARRQLERKTASLEQAMEELHTAQAELVQTEKLSALGQMLAGLAHELNNPLTSVLGYGELLRDHFRESRDSEAAALAEPLVREAIRARALVGNLLQFSRKSELVLGPVDLGGALRLVQSLREFAFTQAGLELRIEDEPGLRVWAEPQRLQQACLNLVNNALDALQETDGRRLVVTTACGDAGWVEIRFTDDGPGFADPARAFDPFYTTKPSGSGTGLGLTLVHRFAEEFGGVVWAENLPGRGACVTLRLLAVPEGFVEAEAEEGVAGLDLEAGEPSSWRVLVVDDEEPIRDLHERLLRRIGAETVLAASGAEAWEVLRTERFDLIVSDLRMPGTIDGLALYRLVARELPELRTRFFVVTGDPDERVHACFEADRILAKPFVTRDYVERIGGALRAVRMA